MFAILKNIKNRLSYYWKLYNKYENQKLRFPNSNIRFYNYGYSAETIQDYWFFRFIEHHKLNQKNKTINILSVFGDKSIINLISGIKIFFTGENLESKNNAHSNYLKFADHYKGKVDLALGFSSGYGISGNYMRFPLWIHYFVPPESTLESLKALIETYNNPGIRKTKDRDRYAVHISRRYKTPIRSEMIEILNKIDTVCCAGEFMKNSNELKEDYGDNKIEFLKKFKFNICPENSNTSGYVTEKLFHAIMSGCIPVYWGDNNSPEPNIINREAIVFYDEDNKENLVEKVRELMESKKAYEDFLNIPPFKENAAEVIWEYLSELRKRLKNVID